MSHPTPANLDTNSALEPSQPNAVGSTDVAASISLALNSQQALLKLTYSLHNRLVTQWHSCTQWASASQPSTTVHNPL